MPDWKTSTITFGQIPTSNIGTVSTSTGIRSMGCASVSLSNWSSGMPSGVGLGPKKVLCIIQSMYPAASTTPNAATAVGHGHTVNVPRNIMISDTNPESAGSPRDANPAMKKNIAMIGICLHNPPKCGICLVCVRS